MPTRVGKLPKNVEEFYRKMWLWDRHAILMPNMDIVYVYTPPKKRKKK